mgnify:CR=1 FL=1
MLKLNLPNRPIEDEGFYTVMVTEVYNVPKSLYVNYLTSLPATAVEVMETAEGVEIAIDEHYLPDYNRKRPADVMIAM